MGIIYPKKRNCAISLSVRHRKVFPQALSLILFTLFIFSLVLLQNTYAGQVVLAWNADTSTTVSGYKVYYGTSSGSYTQSVDTGSATTCTISNLQEGQRYYFAAVAYDSAGNLSGYSNEVNKSIQSMTQYTLTASASSGGSMTPSGIVTVDSGANQTYTLTPNVGYRISGVTVDGVPVGAVSSYSFSNITANHTISATFTANTVPYTLSATAGTGGTITPSGTTTATSGASITYSITPATGYRISNVSVDGTSVGAISSYTFNNIAANHTISATFAATATSSHTITASAASGGSISPAGTVTVSSGASRTFTITPSRRYYISSVLVDGVSVGPVSSYTFSNITANRTIQAYFKHR